MRKYENGGVELFYNHDKTESVALRKRVYRDRINGGFSKVFDPTWNKMGDDFVDESFRAAWRTYIEIMKARIMGSDEVTIYPSELMEKLNLGEMAVRTHLKILQDKGWIRRKFKEKGRHVYIINNMLVRKG